mgnify:CR=1 FL=1
MSDSLTTDLIRSLVDQGEEYYLVHLVPNELRKSCRLYDCDHTPAALDALLQELKTEWA